MQCIFLLCLPKREVFLLPTRHVSPTPTAYVSPTPALHLNFYGSLNSGAAFCFVLFALQLSVCLWWHDYRRDDFPTLKFGVVLADLARHLLREEPFALSAAPAIRAGEPGRC